MECKVKTCDRPAKTRGWCRTHYMRWYKSGDVRENDPIGTPRPQLTLAERLAAYSKRDESGCLVWQRAKNPAGYGTVTNDEGETRLAHRMAWVTRNGPIPDGLQVLHSCDVPSCVNVDHLWLGTRDENMADMAKKRRTANQRLSDDAVRDIRSSDQQLRVLAKQYGVTKSAIHAVRKRRAYGWVDAE